MTKRIRCSLVSLLPLLACLAWPSLLAAQQGNRTTYVYDDNGRLVAVVLASGDSVSYEYDAAGNIVSISRGLYTTVSITEFTPGSGQEGAVVTIYGTGFSTDPNLNAVSFNGAVAVVSSASATQLVATVPHDATTGPISVTTTNGTATSATPFIVSDPPTITAFTPSIGAPDDPVTITGTNFLNDAEGNLVKFNGTVAIVIQATDTEMSTTVPAGATSGHISVTTPGGTVESSADFFVPPAPYLAADVDDTGRLIVGASKIVNINNSGKIGLIVFDATAGQSVGVELSDQSLVSGTLTLFKPDGSVIDSVSLSQSFIDTLPLPDTGTYTLMIAADEGTSGSVTVALNDTTETSGMIIPDGPPVTVTITTPGRNGRLLFDGTAGQRISLLATNIQTTQFWKIYVFNPDGSLLGSTNVGGFIGEGFNDFLDTLTLPATGRYSILIDPPGSLTGDLTLNLYDVPPDVQNSITVDGPTVPVTVLVRGQNALLTFTATAGQRVIVKISDSTLPNTPISLIGPDGTALGFTGYADGFFESPELVAGTHTILIDPYRGTIGSLNVALQTLPADVTDTITLGGPPVTKTTTQPGQNVVLIFSATAGQRASIRLTNLPNSNFGANYLYFYKPDGTMVFGTYIPDNQNFFVDAQDLTETGNYRILVDLAGPTVGNVTVTLYDATDVPGTLIVDGPPTTTTITNPGQSAALSFAGTAGQWLNLTVVSSTIPSNLFAPTGFTVFKPDGSFYSGFVRTTSTTYLLYPLPESGTYKLVVNPFGLSVGTITLRLAQDAPAIPIEVNGPPVTATLSSIGERARLSFQGTAGQHVSVLAPNVNIGFLQVIVFDENGAVIRSNNFGASQVFLENVELPTTGTYFIAVSSLNGSTGSIALSVFDSPVDQTGAITIDGAPVTVTTTKPGENLRLSFNGTANQTVTVRLGLSATLTTGCLELRVNGPDGIPIRASFPCFVNAYELGFITLPADGSYTIVVDPSGPQVGTITVTLITSPPPSPT